MPLNSFSNYPNGFLNGLTVRGVPILNTHFGNIWWVDSGTGNDSGAADGSITKPFATVDYAIGRCAANNGDIILVAPGHAETLTTANTVAQDVAGVAVKGIGKGNDRPTFTFTPTSVGDNPWAVSSASCSIENIIGKPGLDAITNPFNVSAAAAYIDIEWQDASSTVEAETVVLTTAAADNLYVNIKYLGFTAGNACVAPVKLVGCTGGRINVDFYGVASTSIVNFITTLSTDINVTGYAYNSGTTDGSKLVVDTIGSSTWFAEIYDGAAGAKFSGGSGAAIASDDVSAVNTVLGTVATAAATGAVTSTDNLMAYIKQLVTEGIARDAAITTIDNFLDTEVAAILADTDTISGITLPAAPVANSLAAFIASGGTALGTELADSKSIIDALGTDGTTVADTAAGLAGMIGVNDADNAMDTSAVVANANGSVFERDEALQVAAAPSKNHPNYFTVTADMTSATWNTVAAHEIATVTGAVRMQIMVEVAATIITTGTNGTIALGFEGNTAAIFSATALDAALTGDVFSAVYGSAATTPASGADAQSALTHAIFDVVVVNGMDVGYTIATNAGTTGSLTFHVWWQPLSSAGAVTAGAGGAL